jgi:alcohol dehydrogenase
MDGLAPHGRLIMLSVGKDPLSLSTGQLVVGERSAAGSITGTPYETERALDFSMLTDDRGHAAGECGCDLREGKER